MSESFEFSSCGSFVETKLRPWAQGLKSSHNGVRERLAGEIMNGRDTIARVVNQIMLPVCQMYVRKLEQLRAAPAFLGRDVTREMKSAAWVGTGAECQCTPNVAALFVLYYLSEEVKGPIFSLVCDSLGAVIRQDDESFQGDGYDIIPWIAKQADRRHCAAGLMKRALRASVANAFSSVRVVSPKERAQRMQTAIEVFAKETARRCPKCGAPFPEWIRKCIVCDFEIECE